MTALQNEVMDYVRQLDERSLRRAVIWLSEELNSAVYEEKDPFESENAAPLDECDYELLRIIEETEDDNEESYSFDEVLKGMGLTYADLRDTN